MVLPPGLISYSLDILTQVCRLLAFSPSELTRTTKLTRTTFWPRRRPDMAALQALAQQLQPRLRTSGPAPQLTHIMAAILIARDSMTARAACRAILGVPDNVHGRVNKLASRVALLLAGDGLQPNVPPPPPAPPAPPPAPQPEQLADAQAPHAPEVGPCGEVQSLRFTFTFKHSNHFTFTF